jgi:two-component system nitrate/nitrite response regulator NarL
MGRGRSMALRLEVFAGMGVIRVVVVAEVRLHREGLASALTDRPGVDVVGCVGDLEAAHRLLQRRPCDVVLVDAVRTDERVAAVRQAVAGEPAARFVVVGSTESDDDVVAWAEAGAAGIIEHGSSVDELHAVLGTIVRGEFLCSPRIGAALLRRVRVLAHTQPAAGPIVRLTAREKEVLWLLCTGLSNKEIADRAAISLSTVKNHVHNVLDKLGVPNRASAVAMALALAPHARGLVRPAGAARRAPEPSIH